MTSIYIYTATTDGHTIKIAQYINTVLKDITPVHIIDITHQTPNNLPDSGLIVLAASIRYGHHHKSAQRFINRFEQQLNQRPSAFLSVNLVARKKDKNTANTNPYVKKWFTKNHWQPQLCHVAAGMLNYPIYDWLDKSMIKLIMKMTDGPTDTSQCYEMTNWSKIKQFAHDCAELADTY